MRIVSYNVANILAAIKKGGWKSKSCFACSINLLVQNGLKNISDVLNKIKAIVTFCKQSSSTLAKLKQIQMELPELKLKKDVVTRWNSTFDMIERAVKIKATLISTLAWENPDLIILTATDWRLLENLVEILVIFKDITEEISAEKNTTISKILVLVHAMYQHIQFHYTQVTNPQLKEILQVFRNNFFKRFSDIEDIEILTESTEVDPRFKKYSNTINGLRKRLSHFYNNSQTNSTDNLISEFQAYPQQKAPQSKQCGNFSIRE